MVNPNLFDLTPAALFALAMLRHKGPFFVVNIGDTGGGRRK